MSYEDKQWINRQLFFHSDKDFNTSSSLDISVSCNTENGIYFSSPKLSFKLKSSADNSNRQFGFDLPSSIELLASLEEPLSNIEVACKQGFSVDISGYNNHFKIVFLKGRQQENLTALGVIFSDSDSGKIILPLIRFNSVYHILKLFKDQYWTISTDLQNDFKMGQLVLDIQSVKNSILSLPSQISSVGSSPNMTENVSIQPDVVVDAQVEVAPEVADFEKFLDETVDTIEIAEIGSTEAQFKEEKEPEPIAQEIDSPLFNKVYIGDIGNFDSMVNSIYHDDKWPTMKLIEALRIPLGVSNDFKFLPGIDDDTIKALAYLPKVMFKICMSQYLENNVPFSSTFGITKYKASDINSENVELAYDFLLLMAYVKNTRERIEIKISDAHENKSIIYGAMRCFIDPLVFSILSGRDIEVIKSCIITRFRQYNKSGFFDSYKRQIQEKGCNDVTEMDIIVFIDKHMNAANTSDSIKEIHNLNFNEGKLAIPFKNKFKLEQISKEIVELQTMKVMGKDLGLYTQDKKLIDLFMVKQESPTVEKETKITKPKTPKSTQIGKSKVTTPKFVSNLHRCVEGVDFKSQVPDKYKDVFFKYVAEIGQEPYVYEKFPIEELGDGIIQAIYTWNESENMKESYSNFRARLENCMTKDMIIVKIKGTKDIKDDAGTDGGDWMSFADIQI
ncbi:hypothetical protein KAR91_21935 [Candidatus Pacearchaeota archaeon]|nr:hypothetical protein [Candidatus Pacearchaeota archaeon]